MRHDPLFLVWSVNCPSLGECTRLQRWLPDEITQEAVFVDVVSGVQDAHRLGDYFEYVKVLPPGEPSLAFRLLFRRRPTAQRLWKDLMAWVLHKVRDQAPDVTTRLEYRGDDEPK